ANKASGLVNPDLALPRFSALRAVSVEVHYRDRFPARKRFLKKYEDFCLSGQSLCKSVQKL
ncbi:hypothetical protein SNR37_001521, partial [Agarivorans aestuarii]